ncbi:MAG: hypothetical protein IJ347_04570 [Faecalibacterium sp.]|nr:hypothetical protein [Faecalibacterium sp.]
MGDLFGILYLAVFWAAGWALCRRARPQDGPEVLLPLSGAACVGLLGALPVLLGVMLGFRLPAALLALAAAAALGLWACRLRGGTFALPRPAKANRTDAAVLAVCALPALIFTLYLMHTHILHEVNGSYYCGQSTYGDLALHLAFIKNIAVEGRIVPAYPLIAGVENIGYPFLCETVSSVFLLLGAGLKTAYLLPVVPGLVSVFGSMWLLARRMLGSAAKAAAAFVLFFLGGGFGFAYFMGSKEEFLSIFTGYYTTPTNHVTENIRWVNPIADMLVPQRATLFGWCMLFACLYLLWRFALEEELRLWPALAGMAAVLPLMQTHAALALVIICGVLFGCRLWAVIWGQCGIRQLLPWVWFAAVSAVCWLPQLFAVVFAMVGEGHGFLRWHFNWSNEGDNYFWFYIKNMGLIWLLAPAAFFAADKKQKKLFAGGLVILLLAEFIEFQPNNYDNNKLIFVWYLLACILVAGFVCDLLGQIRPLPARLWLGAVLAVVFTLSGVLTLGREAVSSYGQWGEAEIALAAYVDENTPADALFLTGDSHLEPITSLAGRRLLCGSATFNYFHGMDYTAQEAARAALYLAPSEQLLAQWGIDYVKIGGHERYQYPDLNEDWYAARYPVVYQQGGYTLYKIG